MQTLANGVGKLVDFVGAVDFDRFARGIQGDFAMIAPFQVLLELGAGIVRDVVIDQFVEQRQKFCASHFSPTFFLRK